MKTGKIAEFISAELQSTVQVEYSSFSSQSSEKQKWIWVTPAASYSFEMSITETGNRFPDALLLPYEINDYIATYLGFHRAFEIKAIFASVLPVTTATWECLRPDSIDWAIEKPQDVMRFYASIRNSDPGPLFLSDVFTQAIVWENHELVTYVDLVIRRTNMLSRQLIDVWDCKFGACVIKEDLALARKYSQEYLELHMEIFALPTKWIQDSLDKKFIISLLQENLVCVNESQCEELFWQTAFSTTDEHRDLVAALKSNFEGNGVSAPHRRPKKDIFTLYDLVSKCDLDQLRKYSVPESVNDLDMPEF